MHIVSNCGSLGRKLNKYATQYELGILMKKHHPRTQKVYTD